MIIDSRIVNGPGKFDLVISLFHGDSHNRHSVNFVVETDEKGEIYEVEVVINEATRKDGGGDNWFFKGRQADKSGKEVHGCYNTHSRGGRLEGWEK
jgi:hypothetical protein